MAEPTEEQVRELRDYVFGIPTTDNNWEFCREKWMRADAYKWLEEQAALIKARTARSAYG